MHTKHTDKSIALWVFSAAIALLYSLVIGLLEFQGVPVSDFYSFAVTSLQWGVVVFCSCGLVVLLTCNRWVFSVLFPLLLVVSAVLCYFRFAIGLSITPMAVEIFFANATDISMADSLINWKLIVVFLLSVTLAAILVYIRWKRVRTSGRQSVVLGLVGFVIVLCPVTLIKRIQPAVGARLPYALYFSTRQYLNSRHEVLTERNTYTRVDAGPSATPPDVIFVIGESLRADHLPFNGYERNTMPHLATDTAVISFGNMYTDFVYTEASVPHLLTCWKADDPDKAFEEQSFVTLFKKAGYRTAWFANQDVSASYSYFAHECDTIVYCSPLSSLYSYDKWLDGDIVPHFDGWMDASNTAPSLAIVHTIGSHWWYKSHYSENQAVFKPEIMHKDVGDLSREAMINSYDNTIVATDEFLHQIIDKLRDRNAIMVFVSDHGESLGENGVYLHATEDEYLHYPACLFWYSGTYCSLFADKIAALRANRLHSYNTSAVFHTVLSLADITTPAKTDSLSLLYHRRALL